jgi:hypothetical protein
MDDAERRSEELTRIRVQLTALRDEFRAASVEGHHAVAAENWERIKSIAKKESDLLDRFKSLVDSAISGKSVDD